MVFCFWFLFVYELECIKYYWTIFALIIQELYLNSMTLTDVDNFFRFV